MEIEKKKRGRPPKHKTTETTGMTYDGAIRQSHRNRTDKLEKTVTASKSEYVYNPPTDEEFFRALGVHLDEVDDPASVESKPLEKKEDVWAEIRGMRNADQMIADLESGGITSLRDLRSFFWNFKHNDDHTDDLSELKTKIKSLDKLIKMMKQRSKHSDTYKEYRECSAFRQKSFRKKNAESIDSYEQADQYIKEHIKDYAVDGKAPKRSKLESVSMNSVTAFPSRPLLDRLANGKATQSRPSLRSGKLNRQKEKAPRNAYRAFPRACG